MSQAPRREVDLDDDIDRLRYRCPAGHVSWEPTNYHFYCKWCARSHDAAHDPVFESLHDVRTGETLERDEIELTTDAGSYKDLYKGGVDH